MLNSFQRITSSTKFMPEIDGLRFVAISSVVLFHINWFICEKSANITFASLYIRSQINNILAHGHLGVELFFVISGFILSYPFASYYLKNTKKPKLKEYFIRRLTRLEPPYLISMLVLFFALIAMGKHSFNELIPRLIASATYTHNIFYAPELPMINCVAWSLEIEIQFYVLAPLLTSIFMVRKSALRRIIIVLLILFFIIIQSTINLPFKSLLDYIQYFLIGFILTDLVISKHQFCFGNIHTILLGVVSLVYIFAVDPNYIFGNSSIGSYLYKIMLCIFIFVFNYSILFGKSWKKIFSFKILTVIGGMCYSIYLLHYPVISALGNPLVKNIKYVSQYSLYWFLCCFLLITAILFISCVFYKLIEQPCMKKKWYVGLFSKLKRLTLWERLYHNFCWFYKD